MKNTIYKKIIKTITRNTNVLSLNEALQTYPIKRLSKFFDELSDTYNIEIEYDENKAILKKYFIVTEDKYDDLQLFIYHKDYSEISKDVLEKIISEFNRIGYFYSFTDYKYIEDIEKVDCNPVGENVGTIIHEHNATRDYVDYLKSIINVDLSGMKVVLDCANGASYKVAPMVFKELGANVIDINTSPNGKNINDKCGSTHPEMLQKAVQKAINTSYEP